MLLERKTTAHGNMAQRFYRAAPLLLLLVISGLFLNPSVQMEIQFVHALSSLGKFMAPLMMIGSLNPPCNEGLQVYHGELHPKGVFLS